MGYSGKVIKHGSKFYGNVESIDIFTMERGPVVEDLIIPVVKQASNIPEAFFKMENDQPSRQANVAEEYNDYDTDSVEAEMVEKVTLEKQEVEELHAEIERLKKDLIDKEKTIEEMKKGFRKEGYERGRAEGYSKGMAAGANDVKQAVDKMVGDCSAQLARMTDESEKFWSQVISIIEKSMNRIIGENFNHSLIEALIEKIRKNFPDEKKLNLRVSQDFFSLFSSYASQDINVVKDPTMNDRSVIVEMAEGVADYSINTQIQKVIGWLKEDSDV